MSVVITRLFDSYEHASSAVADLETSGIPHADISMVANNTDGRHGTEPVAATDAAPVGTTPVHGEPTAAGTGTGATLGTVLGGGAGLLAGLGMLAIPGVGPVVAAGWLVSTMLGAGVGAGAGGLLGSLVGSGMEEEHAHVFAEGVRRGGTLVTARVAEDRRAEVEAVMAKYSPVDATARGAQYRSDGWEKFDATAPAYTAGGSPSLGLAPTLTPEQGYRPTTLS